MTKRSARTGGGLAAISLSDLQAELRRRQRAARPLLRRRERLVAQLADIDQQLVGHGVTAESLAEAAPTMAVAPARRPGRPAGGATRKTRGAGGRRGGRGNNSMSLVEALQKVLANQQMAVKDLVGAVQAAGYQTSSPNFRTIVNQTLTARPELFKKISRGVYTAK